MSGANSTETENMKDLEDLKEKLPKGNLKRKSNSESGNMKKKVKLFKESQSLEENQRQTRSKRKATSDTLEISPKATPKCVSKNESTRPSQNTASVKVTDLNSLELDKGNFVVDQVCEIGKPEPLNEEEARGMTENYEDEVSIRVGGNAQPSKVLNKKKKEYEGKLLLFDDSEAKVTEEKDFLNSLSPSTSPTSIFSLWIY
ncbi:Ubiquitin carboxyl-terminal hydrolase 1 [Cricetulus griseus]|uniref:Ubiquitin carboxyl-terminal hydrolase 1 n=1 Tax=Cricetulus griseus TaxID=10029 RepID=G3HNN9_CRIGR|nr:Ubiquitin carboxyl-terminal hydrolase 1 [Cricetulus griseus]